MIEILLAVAAVLVLVWLLVRVLLLPPSHARYDTPREFRATDREAASDENEAVLAGLKKMQDTIAEQPRRQQLAAMRSAFDLGVAGVPTNESEIDAVIKPVDEAEVTGEWLLGDGVDPDRRLLYIHGGGFYIGSARSHRALAAALGRACGAAVLSLNYPLMPEHKRIESIESCRLALKWLSQNGPEGPAPANALVVAGDSAGGNLALMLAAWSRGTDNPSLDAVVAFSPSTDSTLSSPSLRANIETDPMLGPGIGWFARLAPTLRALVALLGSRINPRNPVVSPLFDDLAGLPPMLIQASECEMLLDDSVRYANKARAQGSDVTLQTWPEMVHVWQIFAQQLPEAQEALARAGEFVQARVTR